MAVTSDPPAVDVVVKEGLHTSTAHDDAGINAQPAELKTTNTAPLAQDFVSPPTAETPAKTENTNGQAPAHDDDHGTNPLDFQGAVESSNEIPSMETLRKIENYVVLDRDGKTHPFKSLYTGKHVARRVLIIFVRHFFCGVGVPPQAHMHPLL